VHIHIAEQRAEVDACREHTGKTPVELLFDEVDVNRRFSLVHATHASEAERARIVASGATVVLCPLTEAYLGDGVFPAAEFVAQGGNIAIGSDSNTRIDAIEELRLLEYVQRLRDERRLCLADGDTFGHALWLRAARGGGDSAGLGVGNAAGRLGAVEAGALCDLVTLELDRGSLCGVAPEHVVDALLTAGSAAQVRDVYVGGRKVVDRGTLVADDGHGRYVRTLRALAGD
jgi:formiminoglutamate deiminase